MFFRIVAEKEVRCEPELLRQAVIAVIDPSAKAVVAWAVERQAVVIMAAFFHRGLDKYGASQVLQFWGPLAAAGPIFRHLRQD